MLHSNYGLRLFFSGILLGTYHRDGELDGSEYTAYLRIGSDDFEDECCSGCLHGGRVGDL